MTTFLASWHIITCYNQCELQDAIKLAEDSKAAVVNVETRHSRALAQDSDWHTSYEVIYWIDDGKGIHERYPGRSYSDPEIGHEHRINFKW